MSLISILRNSNLITALRHRIPHSWVNTLRHLPNAWFAALYYGFPGQKMTVIGITGSDGKTTTVTGIYHILKTAHKRVSMISTVKAVIGKEETDTGFHVTTPDPWLMQKLLKKIFDQRTKYMVLETTSHGLLQHRLAGINFDTGVITNVSHEHLDYHGTYKNYVAAKTKLLRKVKVAVLNRDDRSFVLLMNYLHQYNQKAKIVVYGSETMPIHKRKHQEINKQGDLIPGTISQELNANKIISEGEKTIFQCQAWTKNGQIKQKSFQVKLPLVGRYNIANTLAMIGASLQYGVPVKVIQTALANFPPIPGRMEIIENRGRKIVIDFAHTPNALEQVLKSLRNLLENPSKLLRTSSLIKEEASPSYFKRGLGGVKRNAAPRLIAVFGSAGLRDHTKRPLMGAAAAKYADITILTAEDPRTENVNDIIDQIAQGCLQAGAVEIKSPLERGSSALLNRGVLQRNGGSIFLRIPDRQKAITLALKLSQPGDIVGIFGKGHEQSMCFGTTEYRWSDREAVQKAIKL